MSQSLDRRGFVALAGAAALMGASPVATPTVTSVPDLRFGYVPVPPSAPALGFDPTGDAKALILAGTPSPATSPISGTQLTVAPGGGARYVIRVPQAWNGKLVVAGTPAFRSEFASDAIWSDYVLAKGYAFASSNKRIPYNAILSPGSAASSTTQTFPIPFDTPLLGGLETGKYTFTFGALTPSHVPVNVWNDDFAELVQSAQAYLRSSTGRTPTRTYAVGLSNGGAQVRSLLERAPQLVDGGVDWSGVYWSPTHNFLRYFPTFLRAMRTYVASGFRDAAAHSAIIAAGYPADRTQPIATHPSLWMDYYSSLPYYTDLTVFAYALMIDPEARSAWEPAMCTPDPTDPVHVPGTCAGSGLATPQGRATYALSAAGARAIGSFAHTGRIGKPLVSIAGSADMFITPANNATTYLQAVNASGSGASYWQYIVRGGTHVDTFAAFGYGLQPQLPFAWAAFEQLVAIVERGAHPSGAGTQHNVDNPSQITT